jgi:hypothetical protein
MNIFGLRIAAGQYGSHFSASPAKTEKPIVTQTENRRKTSVPLDEDIASSAAVVYSNSKVGERVSPIFSLIVSTTSSSPDASPAKTEKPIVTQTENRRKTSVPLDEDIAIIGMAGRYPQAGTLVFRLFSVCVTIGFSVFAGDALKWLPYCSVRKDIVRTA